jgi:L-arabinokinase
MRFLIQGSTGGLGDAEAFVRRLSNLPGDQGGATLLLPGGRDVLVTRAPARLGLFGGLALGTGARVLGWPLGGGQLAGLQRQAEPTLRISRLRPGLGGVGATLELPLHFLETGSHPVNVSLAHEYFARYDDRRWAARVAGAVLVLMRERRIRFGEGLHLLVAASLPEDEGLGTHTALDVAMLRLLAVEANVPMDVGELDRLCHIIEHAVVGHAYPWGDAITAAHAVEGQLLASPGAAEYRAEAVAWPPDLALWGLVLETGRLSRERRRRVLQTAALMAYRVAADLAGLPARRLAPGLVAVEDRRWRGRLAAIPHEEFVGAVLPRLPEELDGTSFLARYQGITVASVEVDPAATYPLRAAARHVIDEQDRARQFEFQLARSGDDRLALLAHLLTGSHESHAACGLSSPDLDAALSATRQRFLARGGLAVSVVAGGEGRALVALARAEAGASVRSLAAELQRSLNARVAIVGGTSPGAHRFGIIRLRGG